MNIDRSIANLGPKGLNPGPKRIKPPLKTHIQAPKIQQFVLTGYRVCKLVIV